VAPTLPPHPAPAPAPARTPPPRLPPLHPTAPPSVIYTHDEDQRREALERLAAARDALAARAPEARRWAGSRVVTPVETAGDYYIAEKYHQQVRRGLGG
jgi:hypothetical protein